MREDTVMLMFSKILVINDIASLYSMMLGYIVNTSVYSIVLVYNHNTSLYSMMLFYIENTSLYSIILVHNNNSGLCPIIFINTLSLQVLNH